MSTGPDVEVPAAEIRSDDQHGSTFTPPLETVSVTETAIRPSWTGFPARKTSWILKPLRAVTM